MEINLTYKEKLALVRYIESTLVIKDGFSPYLEKCDYDLYMAYMKLNLDIDRAKEALAYTE